jgi:predicted CoA-binding protein
VPFQNPGPGEIKAFLERIRTIAVVGLSMDPDRPSYSVAMYLKNNGYRILPVRPDGGEILGQKVYARLTDIPFPVDAVDCFRRSELVGVHLDEAVAIKASGVWMQEGVIDEAAAQRARKAGLFVVMDRCMLKEHRKAGLSNSRPPPKLGTP